MSFIIVLLVLGLIVYFLWNPKAKRIRKIQSLINKDRSVCDVINSLSGWRIDREKKDGLRIVVNPVVMPMYDLYITYKGEAPSSDEIKRLYFELTNENSVVTKAHNLNMPVENYIEASREEKNL